MDLECSNWSGRNTFWMVHAALVSCIIFPEKLGLKVGASLLGAGITISMTGIFYGFAVEQLPASIAIVLLFNLLGLV